VTTFPPSTGCLSEYGFHLAQEIRRNPFLNLTILADELPGEHAEPEGFSVLRCWRFDDPASMRRLLRTLDEVKPDVVWFNLLFSTFGRNPFIAFGGLMTPLLARLQGRYTHVTLHHLMDTVILKDAGVRHETLYRVAGAIATRMLLLSNSVSVLMPAYRKILNDKYGRDNVHLRSHGILARRPEFPDFSRRGNPHRILAFGKWGTYKRLELMLEAFKDVSERLPGTKLVIAGGDHPQAAGYMESVKQKCAGNPQIEFTGYVPEEALPDLFQSSSVAVMPYSSSTGCSGVAHLACAYGVPVVCADLADFRQMAQGEDLAIEFYPAGEAEGLADCLVSFLKDDQKQHEMAGQNFSAALRMTMPNVVQKYLRHFEVQQRKRALKRVSRFRRLPTWMPSRSLLLRFITRNSSSWARRSAILHTSWNGREDFRLLHGNRNSGGKLDGAGTPVDDDGIVGGRAGGDGGDAWSSGGYPTARSGPDDGSGQGTRADNSQEALALALADKSKTHDSEAEQPASRHGLGSLRVIVRGSDSGGGDRESGTDGTDAGSDAGRREGTSESAGQSGAGERNRAIEGA
jgi:glycosyltransferase involved in cell wall biosynthesis